MGSIIPKAREYIFVYNNFFNTSIFHLCFCTLWEIETNFFRFEKLSYQKRFERERFFYLTKIVLTIKRFWALFRQLDFIV